MRRNNRDTRLLMQPRVGRGHGGFQTETIDRDRALRRRHGQIDQQCRASFAPQYFVETYDASLARDQLVAGLFTELFENRIEQRVLERLLDDRARQPEMTAGEA